uniref:Putative secreted protein n=1 Tax=Anopheles marajoara TaxID=58244 RepID=A0A2M4CFL3_9DIPT
MDGFRWLPVPGTLLLLPPVWMKTVETLFGCLLSAVSSAREVDPSGKAPCLRGGLVGTTFLPRAPPC